MNQKTKRSFFTLPRLLSMAFLFAGSLLFFSGRWFVATYGRLGFDSILFTLSSGVGGTQAGLIIRYLLTALLPAIFFTALVSAVLFRRRKKGKFQTLDHHDGILFMVLIACVLIIFAAFDVEFVDYVADQLTQSHLYEKYYVDPHSVQITFPKQKRNLIYIMLESMETTYLSKALGGAKEENLIPELYQLMEENLTFSHADPTQAYGYYTTAGATWTIGSMVAQTAGIPLKTPTEDVNKYGAEGEAFLPGVTSLTNILHDAGYYQALMVGSDASFGGREPYFLQHGLDRIYDVYTARKDGIIPRDYWVWWGMEDQHLFEYAKQELTEIAEMDQPFAFTMLTVDTHHVGGYQCELCGEDTTGESYDQSISCSSRQVADFVTWIQNQDFYENTAIIIVGDHESMDNGYFDRTVDDDYQRRLYNCFINAVPQTAPTENRLFGAVDLFPTTLAAIGCTIEGDRLGLGTNLFSGSKTLMEQLGFQKFNDELAKSSVYYENNFFE